MSKRQIASLHRTPSNRLPNKIIAIFNTSSSIRAAATGAENIYKIYAESFEGEAHLAAIVREAQAMVDAALRPPTH